MIYDLDISEIDNVSGGHVTPGWNFWDDFIRPIIIPMLDVESGGSDSN